MASWGQMGVGLRVAVGVGAVLVLAAFGWMVSRPYPAPPAAPPASVAQRIEPQVAPVPATGAEGKDGRGVVAESVQTLNPTPNPLPNPTPTPASRVEPDAAAERVQGPATEPADGPAPASAALDPPGVDVVRIEADGSAQVAGRAMPGARVVLRVDGVEVAQAASGADGTFVALFTIAPNPSASLLSLLMILPDGAEIAGPEVVALAPITGPLVVAAAPAPVVETAPGPAAGPVPAPAPLSDAWQINAPDPALPPTELPPTAPPPTAPPPAAPPPTALPPAALALAAPPSEAPPAPDAAPARPAALLVTEGGVKLLQTPVPDVQGVAVVIETIAYTPEGAVQFAGRGTEAQLVRLYLDNAVLAEVVVAAGGQWALTKPDIAPGLYTLRADQVDSDGRVTARFETPFLRETLAALSAASAPEMAPGAPADGAALALAAPAASAPVAPPIATPRGATASAPALIPQVVPQAGLVVEPDVAPAGVRPAEAVARDGAPPARVAAPAADRVAEALRAAAAPLESPGVAVQDAPQGHPVASQPSRAAQAPNVIAVPAPVAMADSAQLAAPAADRAPAGTRAPITVTVQPGFTLWAIARAELGAGVMYVQVYEANKDKIRDPDLIYPGQVFAVPAEP